MKCNKCGFVSFDYLTECKKCGIDLTVVREGLGLCSVRPEVPFLLGALLKEHEPFADEHETPVENNMPNDASDPETTEIEFGDELDFSDRSADEMAMEAIEPVREISLPDPLNAEIPEVVMDATDEPEISIELPDERPESIGQKASAAEYLETDMDFNLDLTEEPAEGEKELRFHEGTDVDDLDVITMETQSVQGKSMEIGDEDLLELILEDDDLIFTLETEDQGEPLPGTERAKESKKEKDKIPSIEDINDFVLGLMDNKKK